MHSVFLVKSGVTYSVYQPGPKPLSLPVATSVLCGAALVGMGDVATKGAFEWVIGCTDAVRATSAVLLFCLQPRSIVSY
jgi:hypothetical protein